jgi:hypothetical protein
MLLNVSYLYNSDYGTTYLSSIIQRLIGYQQQHVKEIDYRSKDVRLSLEALIRTENQTIYAESKIYRLSRNMKNVALVASVDMGNQYYEKWKDTIEKSKHVSLEYMRISSMLKRLIASQKISNEYARKTLVKSKKESKAVFVKNLIHHLPILIEKWKFIRVQSQNISLAIEYVFNVANEFQETTKIEMVEYEDVLEKCKKGWELKDYLSFYGGSVLAWGVPATYAATTVGTIFPVIGVNSAIILGIMSGGAVQTYDYQVSIPRKIRDCRQILDSYEIGRKVIEMSQSYIGFLRDNIDEMIIRAESVIYDLERTDEKSYMLFIKSIKDSLEKASNHFISMTVDEQSKRIETVK